MNGDKPERADQTVPEPEQVSTLGESKTKALLDFADIAAAVRDGDTDKLKELQTQSQLLLDMNKRLSALQVDMKTILVVLNEVATESADAQESEAESSDGKLLKKAIALLEADRESKPDREVVQDSGEPAAEQEKDKQEARPGSGITN